MRQLARKSRSDGVPKKRMSYRDEAVIGRALTRAEAVELARIGAKSPL